MVLLMAQDADCIRNYQKPKKYPEVLESTVKQQSHYSYYLFLFGYKLGYVKKFMNILYLKYCQDKLTLF